MNWLVLNRGWFKGHSCRWLPRFLLFRHPCHDSRHALHGPLFRCGSGGSFNHEMVRGISYFFICCYRSGYALLDPFDFSRMDQQTSKTRCLDGYIQAIHGFSLVRNRCVVALDTTKPPLERRLCRKKYRIKLEVWLTKLLHLVHPYGYGQLVPQEEQRFCHPQSFQCGRPWRWYQLPYPQYRREPLLRQRP